MIITIGKQHKNEITDNRKISIVDKNGAWGIAPRQVAGTPVPVFSPFPGKGGRGDRDSKSEVCFKNRLFLQADIILP